MSAANPIKQIELKTNRVIRTWASASEAQRVGGYNYSRIVLACKGRAHTSNGYRWEYSVPEMAEAYVPLCKTKTKKKQNPVSFYNVLTKVKTDFLSCSKAAEKFATSSQIVKTGAFNTRKFLSSKSSIPKYFNNGILFFSNETSLEEIKEAIETLPEECVICKLFYPNKRSLASHLQFVHNVSTRTYTIKNILGLHDSPLCLSPDCKEKTRYTSFSFKEFCKSHSSEAMKKGGEVGGRASSWNKGKTKYNDKRIQKQAIEMLGRNNHFFGRQHEEKTKNTIANKKRLTEAEILSRLQVRIDDFSFDKFNFIKYSSRQFGKIECVCRKCMKSHLKTLQSLERGSLCKFCYPFTVSKGEIEIGTYIEEKKPNIKLERNNRKIIAPYEVDVFIPELKLAFEHHGLYWHMDRGLKDFDKKLHYKKYSLCKEKNITLFQIFSHNWINKQGIVKSMIDNSLGITRYKLGARETVVCLIPSKEAKAFFESTHLQGQVKAKKAFGLRDKKTNKLLSVLSIRKAFHKKYNKTLEIARFSTELNYNVIGGFSKLLKHVYMYAKNNNYSSIISYADLLHGTGNVYKKSGFEYIGHTGINYWYTDGRKVYNRFRFRAQNNKSEKQIAKENKVYKIYGCGNSFFKLDIT